MNYQMHIQFENGDWMHRGYSGYNEHQVLDQFRQEHRDLRVATIRVDNRSILSIKIVDKEGIAAEGIMWECGEIGYFDYPEDIKKLIKESL